MSIYIYIYIYIYVYIIPDMGIDNNFFHNFKFHVFQSSKLRILSTEYSDCNGL